MKRKSRCGYFFHFWVCTMHNAHYIKLHREGLEGLILKVLSSPCSNTFRRPWIRLGLVFCPYLKRSLAYSLIKRKWNGVFFHLSNELKKTKLVFAVCLITQSLNFLILTEYIILFFLAQMCAGLNRVQETTFGIAKCDQSQKFIISPFMSSQVKLIYSEKATLFCEISTNYLPYVLPVK